MSQGVESIRYIESADCEGDGRVKRQCIERVY